MEDRLFCLSNHTPLMKIGLVIMPETDSNLRLAEQLGVTEMVYYDMTGMPDQAEELRAAQERVARFGLNISVVEGGPPTDKIILHKEGRDAQIEHFKRCLQAMGKAGIKTLCFDWMPSSQGVVRTDFEYPLRGGALTSRFEMSDFDDTTRTMEGESTEEQMWDDLEYFYQRVLPAAEDAEVYLALHPDDPPLSPLQGLSRIMRSPEAFERLFQLFPSPSNGMTFCQGCFSEMGTDLPITIRRFADRIRFVHFRDVRGRADSFYETFHDDGQTDMAAAMRAYREVGFEGVIRPDHVPVMEGANRDEADEGYTMLGRLYAVGYMRGLMEAIDRCIPRKSHRVPSDPVPSPGVSESGL